MNSTTLVCERGIDRRTNVSAAGFGYAVFDGNKSFVDTAVIAPVKHQNLWAAGDLPCEPNREAVGVGRRERELPKRQTEAPLQFFADPDRIFAGQHRGNPARELCWTAETVAAGEWPVIAPVSPRQRSTYRWPSTSKISAPRASRTKGGKAPAHLTIQFMGTPPSSDFRARSKRAADLGRSEMNFFCSDCIKEERRSRLIGGIHSPAAVAKI